MPPNFAAAHLWRRVRGVESIMLVLGHLDSTPHQEGLVKAAFDSLFLRVYGGFHHSRPLAKGYMVAVRFCIS